MNSQAKEKELAISTQLCTGCRACEVACSFYLKGYCDPTISKIKIIRDDEKGEISYQMPRYCPECSSVVEPPCVYSCGTKALRVKE